MKMSDFIIVGDTETYKECLIYICYTEKNAENILNRMLNNPDETDKKFIKIYNNFRIKEVPEKDCWWRHRCD